MALIWSAMIFTKGVSRADNEMANRNIYNHRPTEFRKKSRTSGMRTKAKNAKAGNKKSLSGAAFWGSVDMICSTSSSGSDG